MRMSRVADGPSWSSGVELGTYSVPSSSTLTCRTGPLVPATLPSRSAALNSSASKSASVVSVHTRLRGVPRTLSVRLWESELAVPVRTRPWFSS